MSSDIFYTTIGSDDGHTDGSSFINHASNSLEIGDMAGSVRHMFVCVPDIAIIPGSTINSAFFRFTANGLANGVSCFFKVYMNDIDDASAPFNYAAFNALALTGYIAMGGGASWTDGNTYDTPEIKTLVQTVVDRPGWVSGNKMQLIIKNNSSDNNAYRKASSFDFLAGAEKPAFHIDWTVPPFTQRIITIS